MADTARASQRSTKARNLSRNRADGCFIDAYFIALRHAGPRWSPRLYQSYGQRVLRRRRFVYDGARDGRAVVTSRRF